MILQIKAGMGDEIALEPVAREAADRLGRRVIVDGRQPWFWENHPSVLYGSHHATPSDGPLVTINALHPAFERIGNFASNFGAQAGVTPIHDPTPRMYLKDAEIFAAMEKLEAVPEGAPIIVVHPFAGWPSRRWPHDRMVKVCNELRDAGAYLVEVGALMTDCAGEQYSRGSMPVDLQLFGKTMQREAAAILYCADLFVGMDCGPFHLAAAVGTPQVAVMGVKPWYTRSYWNTTPAYPHFPCEQICDGVCQRDIHCLSDGVGVGYVMDRIRLALRRFSRRSRDPKWGISK